MKKSLFLLGVFLFISTNAFAYTINLKDTSSYEYKDGKPSGESPLTSVVLDVDVEKGIIVETSAISTHKGKEIDVKEFVDPGHYQIVVNDNGYIVGAKWLKATLEVIELNQDGTYKVFSSQNNPKVSTTGEIVEGDYTIVSFGAYEIKE